MSKFCVFHQIEHDDALLKDFELKCKKNGLPPGDCPIKTIMESPNKINILDCEYLIQPKNCTSESNWPTEIDLLVTQMPASEKEGWTKGLMGYVANRAFNVMKQNSLVFIVCSALKEEKARPYKLIDIFTSAGFSFIDTIIWAKNRYVPTQGSKRLNNVFSFIFLFSKGDNYFLNRATIAGLRNRMIANKDKDYECAGNIWAINVSERDDIPVELAETVIKLSNLLPNSRILDPFMGTSSFLKGAIKSGHSFFGFEDNAEIFKAHKKLLRGLIRR